MGKEIIVELLLQTGYYFPKEIFLNSEQTFSGPLKAIGPDDVVVGLVDELRVDPESLIDIMERAFYYIVRRRRRMIPRGDDPELSEARQLGHEVDLEGLAKDIQSIPFRQIFKRIDGQGDVVLVTKAVHR